MSWINLKQIILGLAGTTAQKFTLQTPDTPDGTAKLSRGVPGALVQDILGIDASGYVTAEVTPPATDNTKKIASTSWAKLGFVVLLAAVGYIKLPDWLGGVVIQWGSTTTSASANAGVDVPFPLAFPTAARAVYVSNTSTSISGLTIYGGALTTTKFTSAASVAGITLYWLAIGH